MSLGSAIRSLAGPLEPALCRLYRSAFVNVDKVMAGVDPLIPHGSHVLDVGGGDGVMLDALLRSRPDLTATMLDLKADIGRFLSAEVRDRVTLAPQTPMKDQPSADVVLVCDVLHHVPKGDRATFLAEAMGLGNTLIVKDMEPGHFKSWLGMLADRYISGDRGAELSSASEVAEMVGRAPLSCIITPPHYTVQFTRNTG